MPKAEMKKFLAAIQTGFRMQDEAKKNCVIANCEKEPNTSR